MPIGLRNLAPILTLFRQFLRRLFGGFWGYSIGKVTTARFINGITKARGRWNTILGMLPSSRVEVAALLRSRRPGLLVDGTQRQQRCALGVRDAVQAGDVQALVAALGL